MPQLLEDITIGKLRHILETLNGEDISHLDSTDSPAALGWCIVVLDRGFVFVGETTDHGNFIAVEEAAVIRKWGTTKGLGEIAFGGPTKETILDPCPTIHAPKRALIFTMKSDKGKWPQGR